MADGGQIADADGAEAAARRDLKHQRPVPPVVVVGDMLIAAVQGHAEAVIADAQIQRGDGERDLIAVASAGGKATVAQVPGVGAEHVIAEPIPDQQADGEFVEVGVDGEVDLNLHRIADADGADAVVVGDQVYRVDHGGLVAGTDRAVVDAVGFEFADVLFAFQSGDDGVVVVEYVIGSAVAGHDPLIEQDGTVAEGFDGTGVVGDEQQGGALIAELANPGEAFVLEVGVADRQGFIDDQDVGADGGGDAEGEADLHSAGVGTNRLVDVVADFGKGFDGAEMLVEEGDRMTEQLAGHEDVLAAGEVGVKAHAQFQQCGDPAGGFDGAFAGLGGTGDDFQQGAFAGTVVADDADRFAGGDGEADAAHDPVGLVPGQAAGGEPFTQPRPAVGVAFVGFAEVGDANLAHVGFECGGGGKQVRGRAWIGQLIVGVGGLRRGKGKISAGGQSSSTSSPASFRNSRPASPRSSTASPVMPIRLLQSGIRCRRKRSW